MLVKNRFINTVTGNFLIEKNNILIDCITEELVVKIINEVPRFVELQDNYAENFAWQWKKWGHSKTDSSGTRKNLLEEILFRTKFENFDMDGKTILECGAGAGDDTAVLATLPFSEIHSFDLSTSVEELKEHITDSRLILSQASIYDIPYQDGAFDVVYCHRVLQHTPNPIKALSHICSKVKPGGILFVHSYKRSLRNMIQWKYKYRWLTKRLPVTWIYKYVDIFGPFLHKINKLLYNNFITMIFAYNFIPFYHAIRDDLTEEQLIEFEKLATFDALIPEHDHPMTSKQFFGTIKEQGFEIVNKHDPKSSPLWCTAIKKIN